MIEVQNHSATRAFSSSRSADLSAVALAKEEPLELKRVPWSALKPHIDVFEADGKVRTGLLVANNPINEIDPFGLADSHSIDASRSQLAVAARNIQALRESARLIQEQLRDPNLTQCERQTLQNLARTLPAQMASARAAYAHIAAQLAAAGAAGGSAIAGALALGGASVGTAFAAAPLTVAAAIGGTAYGFYQIGSAIGTGIFGSW